MQEHPFKAVSFDLDETLLDGSLFQAAIAETCQWIASIHPTIAPDRLLHANGQAFQNQIDTTLADWTLGKIDGSDLTASIWKEAFTSISHPDDELVKLATEKLEALARASYTLFEDALPTLAKLRSDKIPIALVTNGATGTQREKLRILDLERHFDLIVISGEVGYAKPNHEAFAPVIREFGIEPAEIWHIGDLMQTDVLGANEAGLHSVWLNRKNAAPTHPIEPNRAITSLTELTEKNPGA